MSAVRKASPKFWETLARKKTEKAANEAPLLAVMGLTPTYTGPDLSARRERIMVESQAHYDANEAKWKRETSEAAVEILGLVGPVAFLEFERHIALSPFLSTCAPSVRWTLYVTARTKARRGEPICDEWQAAMAKPRAEVDDDAAYAVIAASPCPLTHAAVADGLGPAANLLDVARAVLRLSDAGRVVPVRKGERFRGWISAERA